MPQFPRTKNDILILAAKIVFGIGNNPAHYPNPPFDPTNLNTLLGTLILQTADRVNKDAAAKAALDLENGTLDEIVTNPGGSSVWPRRRTIRSPRSSRRSAGTCAALRNRSRPWRQLAAPFGRGWRGCGIETLSPGVKRTPSNVQSVALGGLP